MRYLPCVQLLTAVVYLTRPTFGYHAGQAIQINYYSDKVCTAYVGESDLDFGSPVTDRNCWTFSTKKKPKTLNVAAAWTFNGVSVTASCTLYSKEDCSADSEETTRVQFLNAVPGEPAWATCVTYLAPNGFHWKSIQCLQEPF